MRSTLQHDLFDAPPALPEGFVYEPDFLTADEERSLVAASADLPLEEAQLYRSAAGAACACGPTGRASAIAEKK